jgi:hypothetical protein
VSGVSFSSLLEEADNEKQSAMSTTGGEMKNKDLKADGKGNNKEVERRILHQVSTNKH